MSRLVGPDGKPMEVGAAQVNLEGRGQTAIACVPMYEFGLTAWTQSFMASLRGVAGVQMLLGTYIQDGFNDLVLQTLENHPNADWLFFFEHDMEIVNPGILGALLPTYAELGPAVIGGIYFGRKVDDNRPIFGTFDREHHALTRADDALVDKVLANPGLHPMDVVGLGACFVHRRIFEEWDQKHEGWQTEAHSKRYCASGDGDSGHLPWFQTPPGPDVFHCMSHDVFFQWHAKDAGWPVYLDSRILCNHWGPVPFGLGSHMGWRQRRDLAIAHLKAEEEAPVLPTAGA